MARYFAFLRAINVGGHTVTMETLRKLCESFGLSNVETFIASGNLIFQSTDQAAYALEQKIASGLQRALGYEIATFIRSETELAQIVGYQAFPRSELDQAAAFNIAFLYGPLDEMGKRKLMGLTSAIDSFVPHAREIYWLCCKSKVNQPSRTRYWKEPSECDPPCAARIPSINWLPGTDWISRVDWRKKD